MRPEILFPLFAPVTALPGVGPKVAEALSRLAGAKVIDLLWHLPSGMIDRRVTHNIAAARAGRVATLLVRVGRHQPPLTPRQPYRVFCGDDSGSLVLVFFHARGDYLSRVLPVGGERMVSGTVDLFADSLQMTHPDHILGVGERDLLPAFEPVYPLAAGLNPRTLVKLVTAAVARAPELAEWHDPALQRQRGWPSWRQAVEQAHHPQDAAAVLAEAPARMRLAYDEMLANQLALALIRAHGRRGHGRAIAAEGRLAGKALAALGFRLTGSQQRAIAEIAADMAAPRRMLRLLQGDVGSGKTVVALVAMLNAAECGFQATMMAPTEVLARQQLPTVDPSIWKKRYRAINDWERYLTDNGFVVVKVFLNLSKDEQRRRFLARIDDPAKNWKFSAADIHERQFWDDYQIAYSEMLSHTSTEWAPWYVVPADRKWFARICVAAILAHTLMTIDPQFPKLPSASLAELQEARAALLAEDDATG